MRPASAEAGAQIMRGLHGYDTLELIRRRGAHFLGRVKADIKLPVKEILPDASYVSEIGPSWRSRTVQAGSSRCGSSRTE